MKKAIKQLLAVVILGAAGYFGYQHFFGCESTECATSDSVQTEITNVDTTKVDTTKK